MTLDALLRPRRSLVLPALVVAFPALYFVYRDATAGCSAGWSCVDPMHAAAALAGLAGSYLFACAIVALLDVGSLAGEPPVARIAVQPTDRTLAVLAVVLAGIVGYFALSLSGSVPTWLDLVATPVGLVVGLPLVVGYAVMVAVGNALSREPSMAVQVGVVAASLALTAVWTFLLATGVAGLLDRTIPAGFVSG